MSCLRWWQSCKLGKWSEPYDADGAGHVGQYRECARCGAIYGRWMR